MTGDDVELAVRAVRAGAAAARAEADGGLDVRAKGSPADLVSRADTASEAAIVGLLRAERPADAIVGEEGALVAGGARRWLVDGIDGTFNFVSGIPHWCVAVGLEEDGVPVAGAVYDPNADELFAAGPGRPTTRDGERVAVRDGRALEQAAVATYLRADKGADRGATLARLEERVGILRTGGAGSLELAWVAAGRVDAWAQPNVSPWDWVPGAALVAHAGGRTAVLAGDPAWHLAGPPALVDELAALVPRR
ncbi:MAG TPA: inositol monophosphatase [Solirubrobacteraceae bacterium]|nr:inositol monophosphatase [Solirubrobacteraceae bacterium]